MQKKYGKFYADWRDEKGNRKRKAFRTKTAAERFQTRMRRLSTAKKDQAGKRSARSARSSRRKRPTTSAPSSHRTSRLSSAISTPTS
jgi:hypothetical protein